MAHLAVDLLGGDLGSPAFLRGVINALESDVNLSVTLVGDVQLSDIPDKFHARVQLVFAQQFVDMQDTPASALRNKSESSMAQAIQLHAEGLADAVVSGGNTGALVGFGMQILGLLAGVSRPAIAALLPTRRGKTWLLDVGATLNLSTDRLVELAKLGAALSRSYDKRAQPRVALLNVGSEVSKGTGTLKEAAEVMTELDSYDFCGYLEGNQLFNGDIDVVVCDGFSGNVAIKTAQGLTRLMQHELKRALQASGFYRLIVGLLLPVLRKFSKAMDPSLYNGAPLLGLSGLIVKSHGRANEQAFANAIQIAAKMVDQELLKEVSFGMDQ